MLDFIKGLFTKKNPPAVEQAIPEAKKTTSVSVKYSYEWREDVPAEERDTDLHPSRPFCKKMMELKRLYSRADIENLSQRLGYSVFNNCGGDDCRHVWKSNIVIKQTDKD